MRGGGKNTYRYPLWWECAFGAGCLGLVVYFLMPLLLGHTTLSHDNLYWDYPLFSFLAENVIHGKLPLWNPFTHAGEPFYPVMGQVRLWEPVTLLFIYVGKFFTRDTVVLFNWDKFLQGLITIFGIYLYFRPRTDHWVTRFSLILILFFSSILIGHFHQDGILSQFMWVPFLFILLDKILFEAQYRWRYFVLLGALVGLKCQSYWFTGVSLLFSLYFLGLVLFHRDSLKALFRVKANFLKIGLSLAIVLAMFTPDLVLFFDKDHFVFPARMIDKSKVGEAPLGYPEPLEMGPSNIVDGIKMPYALISRTGSFSSIWDFIQVVSPDGNSYVHVPYTCHGRWGYASEAYIYLSILVWAVGLVGMFLGRGTHKRLWLTMFVGFILLMLGPPGGLHRVLYQVFPPLWFVRHTHTMVLYLQFFFLYFYLIGTRYLLDLWHEAKFPAKAKTPLAFTALFGVVVAFSLYATVILEFPLNQWIFVWIAFAAAVGWLLRKPLGAGGLCTAFIVGQLGLVVAIHPLSFPYFTYVLWALILPAVFFFSLLFLQKGHSFAGKEKIFNVVGAMLLLVVGSDLIYGFRQSGSVYRGQPRPDKLINIDSSAHPPVFSGPRKVHELYPPRLFGQGIRYMSLLYRNSSVFSPVLNFEGKDLSFDAAISSQRWVTFLMLRNYFDLIHSGLPPVVLNELFAVGKDPIQFKTGIVHLEDGKIYAYLSDLGREKAVDILQSHVILEGGNVPPSPNPAPTVNDVARDERPSHRIPQSQFNYEIQRYDYNHLELTARSNEPGALLWSDGFDPHWRAFIDDKEVEIVRANGNSKAVRVPAGTHKVVFDYEPKKFIGALKVFYGTFAGSLVFAALSLLGRRKKRSK